MDPVETVTVLFTDLVGSTEMTLRIGPSVAEEIRLEHFGILREAIAEAGGEEIKNLGDGLMVTFSSASGALAAAAMMQRRIARRNRRAEEPPLGPDRGQPRGGDAGRGRLLRGAGDRGGAPLRRGRG